MIAEEFGSRCFTVTWGICVCVDSVRLEKIKKCRKEPKRKEA